MADPTTVAPLTSDQLAAYNNALHSSAPIQMTSGGAQQGMVNFFQTPAYQLLYGSAAGNANSGAAAINAYNPVSAFQNSDPSYQYNIDQAMRNVNNNSAAKGLLESGATQRDLLTTAQGLQNNQYQTWLNQQNSLFGNYQGQLAALAGNLPNVNGSTQANSNAQSLAGLLSGNTMTGATGTSANQINTGSNISSLYANQGAFNANAQMATGAAQANNIFNGLQFQAQLLANQAASNAASQSSMNTAQGQAAGASSYGRGPAFNASTLF